MSRLLTGMRLDVGIFALGDPHFAQHQRGLSRSKIQDLHGLMKVKPLRLSSHNKPALLALQRLKWFFVFGGLLVLSASP